MKKTPKLIFVLTALLFCYGFLLGGQQLVLTTVSEQFGLGALGMGTMIAVMYLSALLTPVVMGTIADRVGKKRILVIFAILFGTGCLLAAFSPALAVFLVSMFFIGAGYSVCESLTSAVCVEVDPQNGARYINLTQCLLSVGAIVGPIVMSNLPAMPFDIWRLLYIFCGIPLILIGLWLIRLPFPKAELVKEKTLIPKPLLTSPVFLALVVSMILYLGLETGFGYFIEILFALKIDGATLSAYGISAYWAGMALSRFVYSLRPYRPRTAVRLSLIAAAVCFLGLILVRSGIFCVLLCALVGASYAPVWSTLVAGAAERFPQYKASATGIMSASCGMGGILFPVLMGAMVEAMDIRIGFVILMVTAGIGAVLTFVLSNNKAKTE